MPQKFIHKPPELVVEHKGVPVYRAYQDDDADQPEQFHFTTNPADTDSASIDSFDVRLLDVPSAHRLKTDQPPPFKGQGGPTQPTRAYRAAVRTWETWFEQTQPALIRQALIEAIELDRLK